MPTVALDLPTRLCGRVPMQLNSSPTVKLLSLWTVQTQNVLYESKSALAVCSGLPACRRESRLSWAGGHAASPLSPAISAAQVIAIEEKLTMV